MGKERVTTASWWSKLFPLLILPFHLRNRHSSRNKITFAVVVESSTIHEEPQKESHPCVPLVIDRQTSVRTLESMEQQTCPNSFYCGWKKTCSTDLGRYPQIREKLQKSSLPQGRSQNNCGTTTTNKPSKQTSAFGCIRNGNKKFTSTVHPLPWRQHCTGLNFQAGWLLPQGKRWLCTQIPQWCGCSWRNTFLSSRTQSTRDDLFGWEKGGDQENSR